MNYLFPVDDGNKKIILIEIQQFIPYDFPIPTLQEQFFENMAEKKQIIRGHKKPNFFEGKIHFGIGFISAAVFC